jgi:hypothetical protein
VGVVDIGEVVAEARCVPEVGVGCRASGQDDVG